MEPAFISSRHRLSGSSRWHRVHVFTTVVSDPSASRRKSGRRMPPASPLIISAPMASMFSMATSKGRRFRRRPSRNAFTAAGPSVTNPINTPFTITRRMSVLSVMSSASRADCSARTASQSAGSCSRMVTHDT